MAPIAQRLRPADAAAVQDQRIGRARPSFRRQQRAQLRLDGHGIVRTNQTDPVGDAQHVAIDRQAGHAERVAEHDVGGLASDAGQLRRVRPSRPAPRRHGVRRARAPCRRSAPRLHPEEAGGAESAARALRVGARQRRGVRIAREQRRRDLVHARVGALRGQDRRDEQLERRCDSAARSSRSDAGRRADRRSSATVADAGRDRGGAAIVVLSGERPGFRRARRSEPCRASSAADPLARRRIRRGLRRLRLLDRAHLFLQRGDEPGDDAERQRDARDDGHAHGLRHLGALDVALGQRPHVAERQRQIERRVRHGAEVRVLAAGLLPDPPGRRERS